MSGHSKWATIHRQKEVKDAKRGAVFTKLGNAITIAVREGGGVGDPDDNFKLRLMVDKARAANMPKENIQRAIDKGMGSGSGSEFVEAVYEGFGPGGAAIMVEAVTDNRQRTVSELKNVFDKGGGTLGSVGSVAYMFEKKGHLLLEIKQDRRDDVIMKLIDIGVDDVDEVEDGIAVYCQPNRLFEVKTAVESLEVQIKNAEILLDPTTTIDVSQIDAEKLQMLLERVEELDDVQKVYTNASFKESEGRK